MIKRVKDNYNEEEGEVVDRHKAGFFEKTETLATEEFGVEFEDTGYRVINTDSESIEILEESLDVNIYYINPKTEERDTEEYESYFRLTNPLLDGEINYKNHIKNVDYSQVAKLEISEDEFDSDRELLNKIYKQCQNEFGNLTEGERSMMVGDLVQVGNEYYIVDTVGFEKIEQGE